MADNAQLISIVNRLAEVNKTLVLSGSLALHLQGVSLRREPHDIDVVVPVDFVPIRGMINIDKSI